MKLEYKMVFNCLFLLLSLMPAMGQAVTGGATTADKEATLRESILRRSESINQIKKERILIDSLRSQIDDLNSLLTLLENRAITQVNPDTIWPLPLLSNDSTIFTMENIKGRGVPPALQDLYDLICTICDIKSDLGTTFIKRDKALDMARDVDEDRREWISKYLKSDIININTKLNDVRAANPRSLLSEERIQYLNNLASQFNTLEPYFPTSDN